jgi:hypothetical protein
VAVLRQARCSGFDQERRGAIVFMAQVMSPFHGRLFAAIEQDLNCQLPESSAGNATAATM